MERSELNENNILRRATEVRERLSAAIELILLIGFFVKNNTVPTSPREAIHTSETSR